MTNRYRCPATNPLPMLRDRTVHHLHQPFTHCVGLPGQLKVLQVFPTETWSPLFNVMVATPSTSSYLRNGA
jgi:hypothetical protein